MASINISGTVYTDEGVTPMGSGRTVKVSVNGAAATVSTTTASDGTYTLTGVTITALQVFVVYLQGNTEVGAAVGVSGNQASVAGYNIYQDYLLLQLPTNTSNPTGTNVNVSDGNGDDGITSIYSAPSNTALTTATGKGLYIKSGATFTTTITTLSVGGSLINAGTWNASGAGLTLTGTGSHKLQRGSGTFGPNPFVLNGPGSTYTLQDAWAMSGSVTITAGNLDISASNFALSFKGNWSNSGTFTARSGTVTNNNSGGATTLDPGASSFFNFTDAGSANLTLQNNALVITGAYQKTAVNTCNLNGQNLTVTGLATVSNSTLTLGSGTSTFNGGLTLSGNPAVTGSSGPVAVNGALTLSAGTFTAPASLTVSGNLSRTSGSFIAGTGTVTLNGTGQTIAGSFSFYNLTKTVAAADTLTFTDGTTTTVTNALTLTGAAGQLLTLAGTSTGGWTLAVPATQSLSYLSVSRSTATGNTAAATHSINGGNNVNWTYGSAVVTVTGTLNGVAMSNSATVTFVN